MDNWGSISWKTDKPSFNLVMCNIARFIFCITFWTDNINEAIQSFNILGRVSQSLTCLATDACLTADPGVASSIPAWSHTFVEIDHEIISTVILLPPADSFKKGCC